MTENSEIPKDLVTSYIYNGQVFIDEKGEPHFKKVIWVEKWNSYLKKYEKHSELDRTEFVTPESLGYSKAEKWEIFIYKTEHDELEDITVYYGTTLFFKIPEESRYRYHYFKRVQSGRIMLIQLDSGVCSEPSVNDKEFCTRGKPHKLAENTLLKLDSPIFTLNSNGELERKVEVNSIYG